MAGNTWGCHSHGPNKLQECFTVRPGQILTVKSQHTLFLFCHSVAQSRQCLVFSDRNSPSREAGWQLSLPRHQRWVGVHEPLSPKRLAACNHPSPSLVTLEQRTWSSQQAELGLSFVLGVFVPISLHVCRRLPKLITAIGSLKGQDSSSGQPRQILSHKRRSKHT